MIRMTKMAALLMLLSSMVFASECLEKAKVISTEIPDKTRKVYETKLAQATKDYIRNPNDADATIWLGRRTAYLGKYKEAIRIFSTGVENHPRDARMYRHRGHRFISIRCFDDAIKDFKKAASLIKGRPDVVEPDGLPNAKNIPTSTLQSNIWYHLGLAQYLKRDFGSAIKSYKEGIKVSKNSDMLVAMTNWLYVAQRRAGLNKEAAETLKTIPGDLELIENEGYYRMIKMYQGKIKPADMVKEGDAALQSATMLYGVGNWYLINGKKKNAADFFTRVMKTGQWASFGYIAAEAEKNSNKEIARLVYQSVVDKK